MNNAVMGISLGTRSMGLAILRDGDLIDWHIKLFTGKWSKEKLDEIILFISRKIARHEITIIALKTADKHRSSHALAILTKELARFCDTQRIPIKHCSISDLKRFANGTDEGNKNTLVKYVGKKYKELAYECEVGNTKRHVYYWRIFEALVAGELLLSTNSKA